ncbi:MAG TPA: ClbS/DfsB family four-helix bundle protein [Dehalococcoidia bacterium]|nr:ClbS/DfsB family four-helix bundle protein [Dehalococcoidia bacterium]
MSRVEELITELEASFKELQESMDGLSHQQMLEKWYGAWCVYDICSHIVGWHHEMDEALQRISRGERPTPDGVDYSDADSWNARFVETWQQSSGQAVLQELEASKDIFVSAARTVPEDKFEEGRSADRIMHATAIHHYREHANDIKKWRQEAGY